LLEKLHFGFSHQEKSKKYRQDMPDGSDYWRNLPLSIKPEKELLMVQQDNFSSAINQKKAPHRSGELKDLKRMRPDEWPQIH
tara:strand:+ start:201 stop:446 length:246 start_codon:yes stop_codon:yes gene_type:complete